MNEARRQARAAGRLAGWLAALNGDNGADLDVLIDDLVAGWPVPVTELALVGHSMGGLHHFDLLTHPQVYRLLGDWLS